MIEKACKFYNGRWILLLLVTVLAVLLLNWGFPGEPETVSAPSMVNSPVPQEEPVTLETEPLPAPLAETPPPAIAKVTQEPPIIKKSEPESRPDESLLNQAYESLYLSTLQPDPLTPPLDPQPPILRDWTPTPADLADPERYDQEEQASRERARAHIQQVAAQRIVSIRKNIAQAQASGVRTPEEVMEAQDALQSVVDLHAHLSGGKAIP